MVEQAQPGPPGGNSGKAEITTGPSAAERTGPGDASRGEIILMFAIFLTVLAFNLVGDGLRDAFDPKSRSR